MIPMIYGQWGSTKVNEGIIFSAGFHLVVAVGEKERAQLDGLEPKGNVQSGFK